ncbi:MAG: HAMP domain-containing sensor histidine kinase [Candidatus Paceibacterota bacterium]|jgi:signal transduction histidine kinase
MNFPWFFKETATAANKQTNFRNVTSVQSEVVDVALHQLKTPMVALKWSIKMLLDKSLGPLTVEQESILLQDYTSCNRAISTIESILKADRIEKQNLILHILNNNLVTIANNKITELRRTAEMKKVTLTFSADNDPALEKIPCDAERISDVFQNLVSNAITYTPENGTVMVSLRRFGNDIRTAISDTGIGISKDHQKNIFVKFYRAPNGARMDPNGTGLGLFIAKTIVEKHGGKCWFESAENKGTTFYFTLPIK